MILKGARKLPLALKENEAIAIYKQLALVNRKIGILDASFQRSIVNHSIFTLLSFNESVQSTRIEGTQVTFSEIMEQRASTEALSWQQKEVFNYNLAIETGIEKIKNGQPISSRMLKELHTILMKDGRGTTSNEGEYRKIQNFIGPDDKIENASYIPIEAHLIDEYMTNLEYFINGMEHPSLAVDHQVGHEYINYDADSLLRIAAAHAQFESIHPFLDGNGRLGRILIALMAVQEGLTSTPIFFVSEELEKERIRYYNALNAARGDQPQWDIWLRFFLNASERMADNLLSKLEKAEKLAQDGLAVCKTENQKNIWLTTFARPVTTASSVAQHLNIHHSTAKTALDYLVSQHFLDKDLHAKRNIKYYNYDLIRTIQS